MDEFDVWLNMLMDAVSTFTSARGHRGREQVLKMMEHSVLRIGLLHRQMEVTPRRDGALARLSDADLLQLLEEAQAAPAGEVFQPASNRVMPLPALGLDDIEEAFDELTWLESGLNEAEAWARRCHCPDLLRQVAATRHAVRREVSRLTDLLFARVAGRADGSHPSASILPFPVPAE